MSAQAGTFSYAQAAKGLTINVTSSSSPSKNTSSPASTAEPKSSTVSESQRESAVTEKRKDEIAMTEETPQADTASTTVLNPSAEQSEKATSPQINGISPPASPDYGVSSTSTLVKEDDQSSAHPPSSESTWDNKSTESVPAENNSDQTEVNVDKGKQRKDSQKDAELDDEFTPQVTLHEAPPPVVNIWKQRAEARAATQPPRSVAQTSRKTSGPSIELAAQSTAATKPDDRKKTAGDTTATGDKGPTNAVSRERKVDGSSSARNQSEQRGPHSRREQRSAEGRKSSGGTRAASREDKVISSPPLPPEHDQESWPTPETAEKEERRKVQDKPEKKDGEEPEKKKGHGKNAWVSVPFTPNVIFHTPIPLARRGGRGGGRGGRDHPARGGSSGGNGSSPSADKSGASLSAFPNGDQPRRGRADTTTVNTSGVKDISPPIRDISPPKSTQAAATRIEEVSTKEGEPSPTKTDFMSNGHDRRLSGDRGQGGSNFGSTRGSGARGRSRRGDYVGGATERRREYDGAAAGTDSQVRTHGRRESVATAQDENADRKTRSATDEAFVQSKQQSFDRRGGSFQTYPNPRESRQRGMRGGRGGAHSYQSSQQLSNQQYANGQSPMMQPYGYPTSRSPPGWLPEQQGPYYPPTQGQPSKNFRGASSRAQSIPSDASYTRFDGVYGGAPPQMSPLQTFMGNMYDPQVAAQTMSAVPYPQFADPYSLYSMVSMQLEYYFSVDNLCKDVYLRRNMDSQGFVSLSLVANFKRVKQLTTDLELIKLVCFESSNIEWRVGGDGKDRLRRRENWQQWVLPKEERDSGAQNDGPEDVKVPIPPVPQGFEQQQQQLLGRHSVPGMPASAIATTAPWGAVSGTVPTYDIASPTESQTGQQMQQAQTIALNGYDTGNSFAASNQGTTGPEMDTLSDAQAEGLSIIVRKQPGSDGSAAPHTSRTLSNGSMDSRNAAETRTSDWQTSGPGPNGSISFRGPSGRPESDSKSQNEVETEPIRHYWVKDNDQPVESLPSETERERYGDLLTKALQEREDLTNGPCPYNVIVLYQFWSHFLIRNFNTNMYNEFRRLALDDYENREVDLGFQTLLKYYKEALSNETYLIRNQVARDYADLAKKDVDSKDGIGRNEKLAFKQLRSQWRDGATSLRNRKRIGTFMDEALRIALEAPADR